MKKGELVLQIGAGETDSEKGFREQGKKKYMF